MAPQLGYIDATYRGGRCFFRLRGEFDLSNAWEVQSALADAMRNGERSIVVDLAEVDFMDAQLLRTLIHARSKAGERGIELAILPPSDEIVGRVAALIDFDVAA